MPRMSSSEERGRKRKRKIETDRENDERRDIKMKKKEWPLLEKMLGFLGLHFAIKNWV